MSNVFENQEIDFHWVGPLIVCVLTLLLWRGGQLLTTRVSFDILENCEVACMKDSVKNNWTNMAVTAALLLTLVVAMLQVDALASVDFLIDDTTRVHLQQTYITLCIGAACCNLVAVFYCIVYLSFVDPLSQTDVMKYLLTYPDSLGDPVVWIMEGCIFMWAALAVWVLAVYGGMAFITCIFFMILFASQIIWTTLTRSAFHPDALDFSWTQTDPSEWKDATNVLNRKIKSSRTAKAQVKKIGKLILEADKRDKVGIAAPEENNM